MSSSCCTQRKVLKGLRRILQSAVGHWCSKMGETRKTMSPHLPNSNRWKIWGEKTWKPIIFRRFQNKIDKNHKKLIAWWFKVTLLGWLSDPFKGLSDLQLGDEKSTLNHLVHHLQFLHISPFHPHSTSLSSPGKSASSSLNTFFLAPTKYEVLWSTIITLW